MRYAAAHLFRQPLVALGESIGEGLCVSACSRIGMLAGAAGQRIHEAPDGFVARREAVAQLPLLALDPGRKRSVVLLELAQAADVGAVRRANQMRQHVNLAEHTLHQLPRS